MQSDLVFVVWYLSANYVKLLSRIVEILLRMLVNSLRTSTKIPTPTSPTLTTVRT